MRPANKKYDLTPERESLLRDRYDGRSETIDALLRHPLFTGLPRFCLQHWASDLGLTHCAVERPWTDDEIAYLETHYHRITPERIGVNLHRSTSSVAKKIRRLHLRRVDAGYTMEALMLGFGCAENTVYRWIESGWLRGKRYDNGTWCFTDGAIRKFVRLHPEQINRHRVDLLWLLDIVFDDGLGNLSKAE